MIYLETKKAVTTVFSCLNPLHKYHTDLLMIISIFPGYLRLARQNWPDK